MDHDNAERMRSANLLRRACERECGSLCAMHVEVCCVRARKRF
jgi:hypothetical protein